MTKKITFILGAGASKDFGLPTGAELTTAIADKVDIRFRDGIEQISGDRTITGALTQLARHPDGRQGDINPFLNAGWSIRDAMPQASSIDTFIDIHRQNKKLEVIGKLAIVSAVLDAERRSSLYIDPRQEEPRLPFGDVASTWYSRLFQIIAAECPKEQLEDRLKQVSFIIFNYDRCLEHYLFHGLQNYYRINADEAAEILSTIAIVHPYGQVGDLPWQDRRAGIQFGSSASSATLLSLSARIKTFTEQIESHVEIENLQQLIVQSEIAVFLGFGFHTQNLKLLRSEQKTGIKRVFATAIGISDSDCKVLSGEIESTMHPMWRSFDVQLRNGLDCIRLLDEYRRHLLLTV